MQQYLEISLKLLLCFAKNGPKAVMPLRSVLSMP